MGTKHFLALMNGEPLPAVPASRALMAPEPQLLPICDIGGEMADALPEGDLMADALPEGDLPDLVVSDALSIPPAMFERDLHGRSVLGSPVLKLDFWSHQSGRRRMYIKCAPASGHKECYRYCRLSK